MKNVILHTLAAALIYCSAFAQPLHAQHHGHARETLPRRSQPYPQDAVRWFRALPVQDGGRIKPFDTIAQVKLLRLNEKRSVRIPDEPLFGALAGEKLSATEWAMDVLLFPEQAADYPVIVVTDSEVLRMIGLDEIVRKKRDRYSWNELAPGINRLRPFHDEYRRIEERNRSALQNQLVGLGGDLVEYEGLHSAFDAARTRLPVGASETLRTAFGDVGSVRFSEAAANSDRLVDAFRTLEAVRGPQWTGAQQREHSALSDFLQIQLRAAQLSSAIVWLPPADQRQERWLNFSGVFEEIRFEGAEPHRSQLEAIALLEDVVDAAAGDALGFHYATEAWVTHVRGMAERRGEGGKVDLEVAYHQADYFYNALVLFLFGFVICSLGFLSPRMRPLYWAGWLLTAAGTVLVTVGMVVRCVLLSRPPVSTLYETILFITGIAVLVALVAEGINRRRIALALGAFLGALGMFVAARFEMLEQRDTLQELQAVLRTNFWLATHVTTVTIGYAGGLLAGFIGHVYLLGKLFGFQKGNAAFYRNVGRMTYGVLCFAVVFATIGTILGGIWANDSWGRFWGWDPKENGALMIVLWQLMILHGRLGGFWRDWGIAMLAVIGNMVVAFSWFGVNLMGVGLHAYGFQAGTKFWLTVFYGTQILVLALGLLARWRDRRTSARVHLTAP